MSQENRGKMLQVRSGQASQTALGPSSSFSLSPGAATGRPQQASRSWLQQLLATVKDSSKPNRPRATSTRWNKWGGQSRIWLRRRHRSSITRCTCIQDRPLLDLTGAIEEGPLRSPTPDSISRQSVISQKSLQGH